MAVITMSSAALIPNFVLNALLFSDVYHIDACQQGAPINIYTPFGTNFNTATVIWLNSNGTGIPDEGWYSDGSIYRQWDGISALAAINVCVVNFAPLSFDVGVGIACGGGVLNDYYFDAGDFANASGIWTDIGLTTPATTGYYSNQVVERFWDGATLAAVSFCDTFLLVNLKFSSTRNVNLCALGDAAYYIPAGETFASTPTLWTNEALSIPAPTGFYSDDSVSREIAGGGFIGINYGCPELLEYSGTLENNACTGADLSAWFFYPFGQTLATATDLYAYVEPDGVPDENTWYAENSGTGAVRYWTTQFTSNAICGTSVTVFTVVHPSDGDIACNTFPTGEVATYVPNGTDFTTAGALYQDGALTLKVVAGKYSNGLHWRSHNAAGFDSAAMVCP